MTPKRGRPRIPEEQLLDELLRLKRKLDGRPSSNDMREFGQYSAQTYYDRWGSWGAALEKAESRRKNVERKDIPRWNTILWECSNCRERQQGELGGPCPRCGLVGYRYPRTGAMQGR